MLLAMKTQSTDVIQLTLTLKMTTAQVVETSVTVNNNSPLQDYVHPDDQTQPTFEMFQTVRQCSHRLTSNSPIGKGANDTKIKQ